MKKLLIACIKFYHILIVRIVSRRYRFYITCSCYGLEAVQKYGAIKGGALAAWRILRCNPFSKGGYDPVP